MYILLDWRITSRGQARSMIKENCGIVAVAGQDITDILFHGLRTIQHRGQESAGLGVFKDGIVVKKGKGLIQRCIPVPDGVWTELLGYLAERRAKRGALLRTMCKGRRLDVKGVNAVVKQAVTRARIEGKVTAKTLRHSFATHLMDRGVELGVIAMLMGHRSPTETGVYLHVLPGKLREAASKIWEEEEE